ncbi:ArdC family protein [Phocaeicola dorei]|uniref:DNA primase TraC n=1 Tax=Phocaeicola dorei DSM 17855 TaxID=483217 RepID=B6W0H0_9BACT|nr:ArdC-like ssDNA-binding domain-containing protein [Phocaeicola dorei]EEB24495.1 hypothetical protein BACDOR_03050 [Phocaeicola dorei DSM 17855]
MNGKVLERYAELMIDKIRQMSAGEWQKPWFTPRTGLPQNISGRPYNSMNRLMLYMEMDRMGYTLPVFMTFRQLKDENLMVIKGSHALPVTFYDITVKHKTTGEKISFDDYKSLPELQKQEYKVTPFMKHFYVFNIDQTDFKEKYPERYEDMRVRFSGPAVADNVKGNGNPRLDKMIKEQKWLCPIELKVQDRAYYSPSQDRIVLPAPGQFKDMESFQMTALHEMAHSTGHSSRLDRGLHHPFGTCGYAREEIIAEFTAAVQAGTGNSRNSEKGERTVSEKLAVKFEGGPRLCHECVTGGRQSIRHDRGKCGKTAHPGRHIRQGRGRIPTSHKRRRKQRNGSFRHSRYV